MSRSTKIDQSTLGRWFYELQENFSVEVLGLLLFLVGGGFGLTLLRGGVDSIYGVPWIVTICGWTAPWLLLSMMIMGAVFMLGERAGHWGVEAIVGIELLLLTLQIATFLWNNDVVTWQARLDGADGGLIGWSFGTLLLAGLGRWPALALDILLGCIGFLLTVRYTPLVYLAPLLAEILAIPADFDMTRWTDRIATWLTWLAARPAVSQPTATLPTGANFVPPAADEWEDAEGPNDYGEPAPPPVYQRQAAEPNAAVAASANPRPAKSARRNDNTPAKKKPVRRKPPVAPGELPALDLLLADEGVYREANARETQQLIESTLEDFNVPVRVVHVESGPTVTQFGVEPLYLERAGQRRKVRVNRIVSLADDLSLALAVPSVRIEAPVPGRPYVGIEVPNTEKVVVSMRGVLESKAFQQEGGILPLALGRNTSGGPVVMDLARAPHMLIAGATGAGKSVCINTIIVGLLMRHGPESLRFVLVDPKMVELPGYNGIPHLLGKVITEVDQVMGALTWLLLQMDDRYQLFKSLGVRNIDSYNALAGKKRKGEEPLAPLPYIVLIIDELADLMMTAADDIERQICRLAQMARATGIHLILATQRPSTDVVTGLIKANFPTRVAFAVTSQIDSRVILDSPGAERLLGRGDMLLMRPDLAKLQRVQGCLVTDPEINAVVNFWQERSDSEDEGAKPPPWAGLLDQLDDEDGLIQDAIDVIRDMESCSTSLLQRKLRVGYPKAARLMEQLEAKGVVGPDQGGGQGRPILLKRQNNEEEDDWGEAAE
ncbi:MAG: DNA translocase FtsK [Caldilineaceae bacterium]